MPVAHRGGRKATKPPVFFFDVWRKTAADYLATETDEAVSMPASAWQPARAALKSPSVNSTKRMRFIKTPCNGGQLQFARCSSSTRKRNRRFGPDFTFTLSFATGEGRAEQAQREEHEKNPLHDNSFAVAGTWMTD